MKNHFSHFEKIHDFYFNTRAIKNCQTLVCVDILNANHTLKYLKIYQVIHV